MKVMPQTIPTPRGCLVGWKVVTKGRYPICQGHSRCSKNSKYIAGSIHVAQCISGPVFKRNFGSYWKTAKALRYRRRTWEQSARNSCLPGIHFCKTVRTTGAWAVGYQEKVIPVAYSRRSIVGKKNNGVIVVYRILVLG